MPKANKVIRAEGAYGTLYHEGVAVLAYWNAGKDFRVIFDGPYFSNRDSNRMRQDGFRYVDIYNYRGEKLLRIEL
jgi:hypothetical protein